MHACSFLLLHLYLNFELQYSFSVTTNQKEILIFTRVYKNRVGDQIT